MAAFSGSVIPRASTMQAMEEAVPITAQCPRLRHRPVSASPNSSSDMTPLRRSSVKRHISLVPILLPLYFPASMAPPDTTIVGISTLQAPITNAGVVLSQPQSRTTPSKGLARSDSSTSMLTRFLYNIAVGLIRVSPRDMTGNSRGNPPASSTPLLTDSANSLKCALQGVSSDQVLQMPITGLPSNSSEGMPWFFIHAL